MNKKGLSPAIATVLLISLALVLAALIFIWANSLLKEKNQKFGEPIENACQKISFEAEMYQNSIGTMQLHVVNRGTVSIQNFDVKLKKTGSISSVGQYGSVIGLANGDSAVIDIADGIVITGNDAIIVPIIVGLQGGKRQPYYCDSSGLNIRVG